MQEKTYPVRREPPVMHQLQNSRTGLFVPRDDTVGADIGAATRSGTTNASPCQQYDSAAVLSSQSCREQQEYRRQCYHHSVEP